MRTPDAALDWLAQQRASGSTAWHNMCESLCRQSYGLPAHYPSANDHAHAIPAAHRYGHEQPRRGSLVLYVNGSYGHIVVATGDGWNVYTNDYGGRGRVTITDARNLISWCGAREWFTADAWWSAGNVQHTQREDDDMAISREDADAVARQVWRYKNESLDTRDVFAMLRHTDANAKAAAQAPPAGAALTDTDVARIARAVADELGRRMDA